jgi:DNA ligase-1
MQWRIDPHRGHRRYVPARRRWLGWCAASLLAPAAVLARGPRKSEGTNGGGGNEVAPALPLAREAMPDVDPAGYLVSEKYDGVRAWWDGRTLRFRSGRPVHAPRWFIDRLPQRALDGELWLGRGRFEALSGLVRRESPRDDEWRALRYMLFELPEGDGTFAQRAQALREIVAASGFEALVAVEQQSVDDRAALQRRLARVVQAGGEGLVLHRADAPYLAGRSDALLKLKPLQDAEAVVVGHLPGRGRHAGAMGALLVRGEDGERFAIGSGFSDAQRADPPRAGAVVTYTYRGRTARATPRFATFLRVRPDV